MQPPVALRRVQQVRQVRRHQQRQKVVQKAPHMLKLSKYQRLCLLED